jgi:hypothetical protein
MKYTTKMIKIPLELYNTLNQCKNVDENWDDEREIAPIKSAKKKMGMLARSVHMADDVKEAHYNQEFKRAQKFSRDREDRPMNVRVQNFSDLIPPEKIPSQSTGGEDDRSVYHDASQEFDESSEGTLMESSSKEKIGHISNYMLANRERLGINSKNQIVEKINGRSRALKSSDFMKILQYHFNPRGKVPTGYQKFLTRCKKDEFLKEQMESSNSEESEMSSGSGIKSGKGIGRCMKKSINNFGRAKPSFKPMLWRIIR